MAAMSALPTPAEVMADVQSWMRSGTAMEGKLRLGLVAVKVARLHARATGANEWEAVREILASLQTPRPVATAVEMAVVDIDASEDAARERERERQAEADYEARVPWGSDV